MVEGENNPDRVLEFLKSHMGLPFTYSMNISVIKLLSQLNSFKIFTAEHKGILIGCIYALDYIYECGYIGGLLMHKDFRKMGAGSMFLRKALDSLKSKYVYLFVEEKNVAAIRLFEKNGFRKLYKRLYCIVPPLTGKPPSKNIERDGDVDWDVLSGTKSFMEKGGVINFGYYPVRLTEKVFNELRKRRKVLKHGDAIVIIEDRVQLRWIQVYLWRKHCEVP
ncbi:MAG: GNAT family N-acetyltransferase [Thermoproteota archaeon]